MKAALALFLVTAFHASAANLVDRGPWAGALTPTSAVVKAKLSVPAATVRLALSKNTDLSRAFYVRARATESPVATFEVRDLEPNRYYYYAVESTGSLDQQHRGRFRTYPTGITSFNFAFASCARTASAHPVFQTILQNTPLFFLHVGDLHYLDIKQNNLDAFRRGYDLVLGSPTQSALYRNVPFVYMWDDHDFGGNDSNAEADVHQAARLTYQEYVPHYPLVAGSGN